MPLPAPTNLVRPVNVTTRVHGQARGQYGIERAPVPPGTRKRLSSFQPGHLRGAPHHNQEDMMDAVQIALMAVCGLEGLGLLALAIFEPDAEPIDKDENDE